MQRSLMFVFVMTVSVTSVFSQSNISFELTSAFPVNLYQHGPRDYFMTTKYDAAVALRTGNHAELLTSFTFTQQRPFFTQNATPFDGIQAASQTIYVPFTSDPYYTEYGLYSGVRLKTNKNTIEAFITGQLGITGTKYGTIHRVPHSQPELHIGRPANRYNEASVITVQMAAMYGAGLMWHPVSSVSILTGLHAVDRLTKQSLDVYRSIGVQLGL